MNPDLSSRLQPLKGVKKNEDRTGFLRTENYEPAARILGQDFVLPPGIQLPEGIDRLATAQAAPAGSPDRVAETKHHGPQERRGQPTHAIRSDYPIHVVLLHPLSLARAAGHRFQILIQRTFPR